MFTIQTKLNLLCKLALLLVAFSTTGCSSTKSDGWKFAQGWDVRKAVGLKSDKPDPPETPTRLVCSWTQAVHHQGGSQPKRGFGGRVVFFKRDSDLPVRVDGQLVVYAFDESNREAHETHPTKRFIFPAEQFVRHESQTKLGPAYSVWLPWDAVGGPQKNVTLITRFEPKDGALIVGEPTKSLLPGTELKQVRPMLAEQSESQEIKLASYSGEIENSESKPAETTRSELNTATFQVPKSLGDRLADSAPRIRSSRDNLQQQPARRQTTRPQPPSPRSEVAKIETNETDAKEPKASARRSLRSEPLRDSLRATLPAQ